MQIEPYKSVPHPSTQAIYIIKLAKAQSNYQRHVKNFFHLGSKMDSSKREI